MPERLASVVCVCVCVYIVPKCRKQEEMQKVYPSCVSSGEGGGKWDIELPRMVSTLNSTSASSSVESGAEAVAGSFEESSGGVPDLELPCVGSGDLLPPRWVS